MDAYSIDLGLDMAATRGNPGTLTQPFPMQIGICRGQLEADGSFAPDGTTASFLGLESRQSLIVRIFDITAAGSNLDRTLQAPLYLRLSFRDRDGVSIPDPWTASGNAAALTLPEPATCLTFAGSTQTSFPCYRQVDPHLAPVVYRLLDVGGPTIFLMSALLAAYVIEGKVYQTRYFGRDPEMVVGPYDGGN